MGGVKSKYDVQMTGGIVKIMMKVDRGREGVQKTENFADVI